MASKKNADGADTQEYTVNPNCDIGGYTFENGVHVDLGAPTALTQEQASECTDQVRGSKVLVKYPAT